MLAGFMALVAAGWTVSASAPLDPARSQLAVHAAAGSGRSWWLLGNGARLGPRRGADANPARSTGAHCGTIVPGADIRERAERHLPPRDHIRKSRRSGWSSGLVDPRRCSDSRLSRTSRSRSLWCCRPVWRCWWWKPKALSCRASLRPLSCRRPGQTGAADMRVSTPLRMWTRFFLDGNVFPEADGFWVRGGADHRARVESGSAAASRAGTLTLRNGAAANTVTIQSGAWQEVLSLTPGEARTVALPQADALGAWPLTITSDSGFRPSDTAGEDRRFLGVWIDPERGARNRRTEAGPLGPAWPGLKTRPPIFRQNRSAPPNQMPWNVKSPLSCSTLRKVCMRRQPACTPK